MAGSYLNQTEVVTSYELSGDRRYETSASSQNFGWHWDQPEAVVIGRGIISIDSLRGNVLASEFSSPLLLTETDRLPTEVSRELSRISPKRVYLLSGEREIISKGVEQQCSNCCLPVILSGLLEKLGQNLLCYSFRGYGS